jgi:hypothetical protein
MNFGEQDADVFGVVPGNRFGHGEFPRKSFQFLVSNFWILALAEIGN